MSRQRLQINHNNKRKKSIKIIILFILVILVTVLLISIFFLKNYKSSAKKIKLGNNTNSQEILDNILNISSYETKIEVNVLSNKNENKYIIKQTYNGEEKNTQEILEPSNIAGVKIIKDGRILKLENSELNLTTIIENYKPISENDLDLSSFIKDYKQNTKTDIKEKDNQIILKTRSSENQNKIKILYISKETGMPVKMEVQDNNKKTAVYILYNKVNVNS